MLHDSTFLFFVMINFLLLAIAVAGVFIADYRHKRLGLVATQAQRTFVTGQAAPRPVHPVTKVVQPNPATMSTSSSPLMVGYKANNPVIASLNIYYRKINPDLIPVLELVGDVDSPLLRVTITTSRTPDGHDLYFLESSDIFVHQSRFKPVFTALISAKAMACLTQQPWITHIQLYRPAPSPPSTKS